VIFIEASAFSKLLPNYLSDEDYRALQTHLMQKPDQEIWMLTIYSKAERTTIPGHILKQIAEAIDHG
jgi:hypothetical protein